MFTLPGFRAKAYIRAPRDPRNRAKTASRYAVRFPGPEGLERRCLLTQQFTLGSLLLEGTFTQSGSTETSTTQVRIGFAPISPETSFTALTDWTGTLSFTQSGSSFDFSGLIEGIESSSTPSIAQISSTQTFDVNSLISSPGVSISGGTAVGGFGASLTPNTLALIDPSTTTTVDSYVSLQGSLGFTELPGLSVPVSGSNAITIEPSEPAPGITLAASATTSEFTAFGASFGPDSLSVGYSSSASEFEISGSASMATSSGDFSVSGSLGTTDAPGLLIDDTGSVTQLSLTLSTDISTYGLNIDADSLTLNYQSSVPDEYIIQSGGISASDSSGDFSFAGQFGSNSQPGVVIDNGSLTSLYANLNGSATAGGLTMTATNDVLEFSAASGDTPAEFEIASGDITVGSVSTAVTFEAQFGSGNNPGVVLQNGSLVSLDMTVTSSMTVAGLSLTANNVEFQYQSAGSTASSGTFEITRGMVSVGMSSDPVYFSGTFGGTDSNGNPLPGLAMAGSSLTSLDITVSSSMTIAGLSVTASGVDFEYESSGSTSSSGVFEITQGMVTVGMSSDPVYFSGTFGGTDSNGNPLPGLAMTGSSLTSLDITVSSSMTVAGLSVTASGVDFEYESSGSTSSSGVFEITQGMVTVGMSSDPVYFSGTFGGTDSNGNPLPGLAMTGSSLTSLDITVSSSMTIAGLSVTASGVDFEYESSGSTSSSGVFEITQGMVTVGMSSDPVYFSGTFGGTDSNGNPLPGLAMAGSSLTSLDITVSTSMTVAGLSVTASGVDFEYESSDSTSSSGVFEITQGMVTVGMSSDPVYFSGTFGGTDSNGNPLPGLAMAGSSLTSLDITVSSSMTIAGLSVTASGVDFEYESSGSTSSSGVFEIASGMVTVGTSGSAFYFEGTFGTPATNNTSAVPGLQMTGSTLTGVDITITSSMSVSGMSLQVNDLQFLYESGSSTAYNGLYDGDYVIAAGGNVSFSTSAGDTTFSALFGSGDSPGLVLHNGVLQNLYATVSSTINAQGLTLDVDNLEFQYLSSGSYFEIHSGSVSISSGDIQFASANFVTVGTAPGLEISDGVLEALNIQIDSDLTVSGMTLTIMNLQFDYQSVADQTYGDFEIASGGTVTLSAGSSNALSFTGSFGEGTTPGLSISDGVLQSFYIGVSSNISLGGLTLTATDLVFSYSSSTETFEIPSGMVSVTDSNGDFSFTGTFGTTTSTTTNPGLVVDGDSADSTYGSLTELNVTVSAKFVAGGSTSTGLTFNVKDLNFSYNSAANQYEIDTGSLSFNTSEGYSFSASFGLPSPTNSSVTLPGLVIQNGELTSFNASLTSSFTVAGLAIDVTDVAMNYSAGEFAMYGTVSVNTTNVSFTGQIGDPNTSTYGLIISDNTLKSLAISITSTVTFGQLTMTAAPLAFNYASSPEEFTLYGNVDVSVAGVDLTGNLGTESLPGLTIVNGALTELNLGVSASFTLFGVTCDIQDLTFQYQTSGSKTEYIMYGALSLVVGEPGSSPTSPGETMSATMGTASNPGLIVQVTPTTSTVEQINMAISGSFNVSGFGFSIVDAGCDYTANNNEYLIFGTFTLSDVFTASVQLGTGSSNPGITIINGNFQLDNFAFSLDNVPIGAFTLNYVDISYASTNDVWSGAAQVTFPTGWSVAASMTFVNGVLDDISLSYDAGTSAGIAIPETGMFVTEISASLENLDEPANIIVSGSIQAIFGKEISIGGTGCAIFAATGSFTADSQELIINGAYYEGAVETNGNWTGILGQGTASVDLDWGAGVYTASVSESLYDGTFVISASIAFDDSGDLGIIATASVNVPDAVPFIGGTQLGSMGFAFIYTASSNSGTVAAWINVNLIFYTVTTGFEYSFSSGSSGTFSLIGAGGVNSIKNSFKSISSADTSVPPVYVYTYSVTVASGTGSDGVSVQATWPANSGTQTLEINGPNDGSTYYSLSSPPPSSDNDQFLTQYTTTTSQSMITNGSESNSAVLLPPGTYNFEIQSTYEFPSSSDVSFTNQLYYQPPTVAITSVPSKALTFVPAMTGFAAGALTSDTTITLYAQSGSSGYAGKEVGSFGYSVNSSGVLQNVPTIDLSSYSPGVPIYIYAIIDDGTNSAVYSSLSSAIIPVPNLVGQVIDQFGNPIAGLTIFLDLNNDGTDDVPNMSGGTSTLAADPSAVTNANGDYYFNNLGSYSATDIGYPTFRVTAVMPSVSFTPITPTNSVNAINNSTVATSSTTVTESIVANFSVNRLASIAGSIYSDLNQDGVQVASDPALGGATVYLDASGTGTYQTGDPTCVTGPSGMYGFYGLSVPTIGNYGFESPNLGAGNFEYAPTGTGQDWTFSSSAGIAANGSTLTDNNASAPQGSQVAFLQDASTFSQSIGGFLADQSYYVSFYAASRVGDPQSSFTVSYNGTAIGTFSPTTGYESLSTSTFSPGAGSLTLKFTGIDPSSADQTAFIDDIQVLPVTTFTAGILNATTVGVGSTVNSAYNYVVTQPASGTYSIPVASDAPQLTGYTFGVISLATVVGVVTSQGTAQGATAAGLSGTTVDVSTPNRTASVPNFGNFQSTNGLNLIRSSVTSSGGLQLLQESGSGLATAAWYKTPVPLLGGFETDYQWSMSSSGATSGGFGFVIQNSSSGTSALGQTTYGYGGITPSIAVIFDAVDNEVLIESGGDTASSSAIAVLTSQELGFTLASGTVYTARIVFQPTNSSGQGTLSVYLSGDSSGGLTPVVATSMNLTSLLALGNSGTALVGFTAGTSGTGLAAVIDSWTLSAANTESTTTNSSGDYTFTGLYPTSAYTVSQVIPAGEIQSEPFNTKGVYSELNLGAVGAIVSSVASGDLNGDGYPDVAYAVSLDVAPYEIAYAIGNGQGGFGGPVLVALPVPAGSPTLATPTTGGSNDAFIAAGDFGSLSHDDITYVAPMAGGGDVVVVYDIDTHTVIDLVEINSAGFSSSFGQYLPSTANPWTINNLAVGDLNNDGYDDLAVSVYGGVYTLIDLQDSSSSSNWTVDPPTLANPFGTPSLLGSTTSTAFDAGVTIADFNQDGNPDLATVGVQYLPSSTSSDRSGTTSSFTNMTVAATIQLAYGIGDGVDFTPQPQQTFQDYTSDNIDQYFSTSSASPTFPIPFGVTATDINGDEIPDLVLNGFTDLLQPAVIEFVQSGGTFTNFDTLPFPNGEGFDVNAGSSLLAAQVVGTDLNGDGFNDIAAVDPNVGQIMLLTTSAAPLTTSQTQTTLVFAGGALPEFAAADYSQDGYPDLIIPGNNQVSSQTAPVMVLNGTLNVGTISYTPTNGEVLSGQNFADIDFAGTSSVTNVAAAAAPEIADSVDPALSNASMPTTFTIGGRLYLDRNQDARYNAGESGLGGLTLYIDTNQSGRFDPAIDPSAVTDSLGYYSFSGLAPDETYHIGIANLPTTDNSTELIVSTPRANETGIIDRNIPVTARWSVPQPTQTIDPLTPIAIDLAPLSFRASLAITPKFMLTGSIPSGMTIDPYTGQIRWTAPWSDAGSSLTITVRIEDRANPSALESQSNQFQIRVNALSTVALYIRDVYGALLERLPSTTELSQWTAKLKSGTSLVSFVSTVAHTNERYQILIDDTYLTVLNREPTPQESASALAMFQSGGNSDRLTRQLLTSSEFIAAHQGNLTYVNAVNQLLTTQKASAATTATEVALLRMGGSRTRLVNSISTSQAATNAKARQLAVRYLGQPASGAIQSQWAKSLANGTLNTDSLTTLILASQTYANGSTGRTIPNIQAPSTAVSPQYNQLAHLQFEIAGSFASRSQLDSLESQLYNGQTWRQLARGLYKGQTATEGRIQTQFLNLLRRRATTIELAKLTRTLPSLNQTEALQVQILAGSEYRTRFASTTAYVNSVYQSLTGVTPSLKQALSATTRIERGMSLNAFVKGVAASNAGRVGQIDRLYDQYLGRQPSASELKAALRQFATRPVQDQPVALQLLMTNEFRLQQRGAQLLPSSPTA